jgi:hypothetical protein
MIDHFTAPRLRPPTIWRCASTAKISIGRIEVMAAADSAPQSIEA